MLRRLVSFVIIIFLYGIIAKAQICRISENGDSVEAQSCSLSGNNNVIVTLSNDSNDAAANITLTIEVTYINNFNKSLKKAVTYSGKSMVKPLETKNLEIPISSNYNGDTNYIPSNAEIISIIGNKCR